MDRNLCVTNTTVATVGCQAKQMARTANGDRQKNMYLQSSGRWAIMSEGNEESVLWNCLLSTPTTTSLFKCFVASISF